MPYIENSLSLTGLCDAAPSYMVDKTINPAIRNRLIVRLKEASKAELVVRLQYSAPSSKFQIHIADRSDHIDDDLICSFLCRISQRGISILFAWGWWIGYGTYQMTLMIQEHLFDGSFIFYQHNSSP